MAIVLEKFEIEYENGIKQEKYLIPNIPFFTTKSPLGEAMHTGILELPETQGGKQRVKFKKIE